MKTLPTQMIFNKEDAAKLQDEIAEFDNLVEGYTIENKRLKEAENKINSLLKSNPKEPKFYNLQGLLAVTNKQPELAIKSHQKAIDLDQKNLKAHLSIANISLDTGNITQAKKHANKAIAINDSSTYAYFLLADIARIQNKLQEAENLLLTAQKKNQGNAKQEIAIANNLGKLYAVQKQPRKILSLAEEIINRYPENSSAMLLLANAQLINNQKKQAEQTLNKLVNIK